MIECHVAQLGMISTFTSHDRSDALINYLMMTDKERTNAMVPISELREEAAACRANPFLTFNYEETPEILHESQCKILCELLECVWGNASMTEKSERVDMRMTLTCEQMVSVSSNSNTYLCGYDQSYPHICFLPKYSYLLL